MFHFAQGRTADDVWRDLAARFSVGSEPVFTEGRGERTVELLHVGLSISDPRERWVTSREPPMNPAYALAEVLWILSGRRDARFLRYWNSKLPDYVGEGPQLHGAYGYRLRHHRGLDQLERALSALSGLPSSRQVVLQIWDSAVDLPEPDGRPSSQDVPCNVMSLLKVRDGRLEWMQIVRSNDVFLGVPYNIVQFTFLQEVFAGWLGVKLGTYNQLSDSLHVYEHDLERVRKTGLVPAVENTDQYGLSKSEWDRVIVEMILRVEQLISDDLSQQQIRTVAKDAQVPSSYRNMLTILAAEAARRRSWIDTSYDLAARCTNPALTQVWDRWSAKRSERRANDGTRTETRT